MPAPARPDLHRWDLPPQEAVQLQRTLAGQLITDQVLPLEKVHTVAGVDVSVKDNISRAAIVILSFPALEVIEAVTARMPTPYPYVPGLLSFREGPIILEAYQKLRTTPDALIFDGQGQIHPRRIGIAAHIGLWLEQPTLGCGKTHFVGAYREPGINKGDFESLYHPDGGPLGVVLRTRANVKPVYISPGHQCTIESALALVMGCVTRYRLPEPIRAAHHHAAL